MNAKHLIHIPFLFLMTFTSSCQNKKDKHYYFEQFKKKYTFLNNYKWDVNYGDTDSGGAIDVFAWTQLSNDTTLQAILHKSHDENSNEVFSIELGKIFKKDDSTLFISLDEDFNHRYSYKNDAYGNIIFESGKYLYLFETSKLNEGQQKYFIKHADSLKRIKGNNLPPLPDY